MVDDSGRAVGSIMIKDVKHLLTASETNRDYRSGLYIYIYICTHLFTWQHHQSQRQVWLTIITCRTLTAKKFIANARQSSGERQMSIITCSRGDSIKDIILKLDVEKSQRIYVINEEGNLDGLITLRDIIAKLLYEPPGYFGDFFNGVIPLPSNSRV